VTQEQPAVVLHLYTMTRRRRRCHWGEAVDVLLYWVPVAIITTRSSTDGTTPPAYSTVITKADDSSVTSVV
jgi:hypothetical protein